MGGLGLCFGCGLAGTDVAVGGMAVVAATDEWEEGTEGCGGKRFLEGEGMALEEDAGATLGGAGATLTGEGGFLVGATFFQVGELTAG